MSDEPHKRDEQQKRTGPKTENSNLPVLTDVLKDDEVANHTKKLLAEAARIKPRLDEYESRMKDIKSELLAIAVFHELSGFRHNKVGFRYSGTQSRKVLSKEKIVYIFADVGLPAEKINECYVDGKEWEQTSIVLFD